jgi:GTP cyclohydrolase I
MVRDVAFHSLCEHHLLPFFGKAHVAYLPAGRKVVGLSKLARTVEVFARRPQMQERLTGQIADALVEHLDPRGVAVIVESRHLCMGARGACRPDADMLTTAVRGTFADDAAARKEVFDLLTGRAGRSC